MKEMLLAAWRLFVPALIIVLCVVFLWAVGRDADAQEKIAPCETLEAIVRRVFDERQKLEDERSAQQTAELIEQLMNMPIPDLEAIVGGED